MNQTNLPSNVPSPNPAPQAIVLIPSTIPSELDTSIEQLNGPLADLLTHIGLPTENILATVSERRKVIFSIENAIEDLDPAQRFQSDYLSKFLVSISVGLFDGALNYLWNEAIKAIRGLVVKFDLQYIFETAATINSKYRNLSSPEDLQALSDHDLLDICRRVGLIDDVNFHRLEHSNYLRNHASAAHPNNNTITGTEMLSILENCVKYAINAEFDASVVQLKQLMANIRTNVIPDGDDVVIGVEIKKMSETRKNDFSKAIFGMYVDPSQTPQVKTNIEKIMKQIWDSLEDDTKYFIGAKYGYYRKNGDTPRKEASEQLLVIVNGNKYKDSESLTAELIDKVSSLKTVHFEQNNFYNEFPHALSIYQSIPANGIPDANRNEFVKVICLCHIGNGQGYRDGVDERADKVYSYIINNSFGSKEIIAFIRAFKDGDFTIHIDRGTPDNRARDLANTLKQKTTDPHVINLLDLIINFPKRNLSSLHREGRYVTGLREIDQ